MSDPRRSNGVVCGTAILTLACLVAACGGDAPPPKETEWDVETLAGYLLEPERFRAENPRIRELQGFYPEATMPEFDYPEAERRALAAWLLAGAGSPAEDEKGAALYQEWGCLMCHGEGREGSELGPSLLELRGRR